MSDPITVEIVCRHCGGDGLDHERDERGTLLPATGTRKCGWCKGDGWDEATLSPGSLAALKIVLADIGLRPPVVIRSSDHTPEERLEDMRRWEAVRIEYDAAIAAVRNHPDYEEPTDE